MLRIFIFILTVSPFLVKAQTANPQQDTITWTATSDTNLITNDSFTRPSTFVSYAQARVEWVKGVKAKVFTITSVESNWTDVSQQGKLIYHVLFNGQTGLITIARDANGLTLTLDMTPSSPDGIKNQYSINQYTVN